MLASAGKKEHLFLTRPLSGCFLQENTCIEVSFLVLSIRKFLRAPTVKNICKEHLHVFMKLRIYKEI